MSRPAPRAGLWLVLCLAHLITLPLTRGQDVQPLVPAPVGPAVVGPTAETESLVPAPSASPAVLPAADRKLPFGDNPFRSQPDPGTPPNRGAITEGRDSLQQELGEVWRLERRRQYARALERIDAVVIAHPRDPHARLIRAYLRCVNMRSGDFKAIARARRDLDLTFPSETGPFRTAVEGILAYRKGQYVCAIGRLDQAIQEGCDGAVYRMFRGMSRSETGDVPAAIADFDTAARLDPECYEAYRNAAHAYLSMGDAKEALARMEKALGLRPTSASLRIMAIEQAANLGLYGVARANLDHLIAGHPDWPYAHAVRGLLRWIAGGDLSQVATDIDRALALQPRDWSFHALRAVLHYRQAKYARAMGDAANCSMVLTRTNFKIVWKLESRPDGHGWFFIGLIWRYQGSTDRDPHDLEHRLVNLGLNTLWSASRTGVD